MVRVVHESRFKDDILEEIAARVIGKLFPEMDIDNTTIKLSEASLMLYYPKKNEEYDKRAIYVGLATLISESIKAKIRRAEYNSITSVLEEVADFAYRRYNPLRGDKKSFSKSYSTQRSVVIWKKS